MKKEQGIKTKRFRSKTTRPSQLHPPQVVTLTLEKGPSANVILTLKSGVIILGSTGTRAKPAVASCEGMESLSSSSASSVDEAQQERPGGRQMHAASRSVNGPNEDVAHHEEDEEVIYLGDEGFPLHARGPNESIRYSDIETTEEDEEESTSMLTKSAVRGFSGVKQLALIAAIGVMLAVFGRRLMRPTSTPVKPPSSNLQSSSGLQQPESQREKLLLPPVEKDIEQPPPAISSTPEEPPSKDIEELKSQQRELRGQTERLRQAWRDAGDDVRVLFGSKLASFKQRFSGDTSPDAAAVHSRLLDDLLIPATKMQEAPIPASQEDRVTLKIQLLVMNACVSAANTRMTSWREFSKAQLEQCEKLMETSSVSVATFLRLIEGGAEIKPEVQDQSSPRIPASLARNVAMRVFGTKLQAEAAVKSYDALEPLMNELEVAEHLAGSLPIPEGGVFPPTSFISFMESAQNSKKNLHRLASQAAEKLVRNFTFEGAQACFSDIERSTAEEARALEDLSGRLARRASGQDRRLYFTMLGLLM
ncbi:hypothetical protein Emed_005907 [Eimeria media]